MWNRGIRKKFVVLQDGSRSFGLFRKGKIGIIAKFIGLIKLFEVILEGQKPRLIAR